MAQRLRRLIVGVWASLLAAAPLGAQEPGPPPMPPAGAIPPAPEPVYQWLDEVRAQRQAREERRRAAKEAMDERRRHINPRGAAKQEAWEQETQRRRDVFMEKIERDRRAFRDRAPWGPTHNPWQDKGLDTRAEPRSSSNPNSAQGTGQALTPSSPYPLPGWDNRWYYRGY